MAQRGMADSVEMPDREERQEPREAMVVLAVWVEKGVQAVAHAAARVVAWGEPAEPVAKDWVARFTARPRFGYSGARSRIRRRSEERVARVAKADWFGRIALL